MTAEEFMSGLYEEKINKKMMYYDYEFPVEEVIEYANSVCDIAIPTLIKYILAMPAPAVTAQDVFQFSSFDDATVRLCVRMKEVDNPGLTHIEVGKLLLNDGVIRNDGAYTKYGENHAKAAASIGLVQELSKTYFLSCIGYIYPAIDDTDKQKLLVRLLLRNVLIRRIICATNNGNLQLRQLLYMISDSTYKRRCSNIKRIISELSNSNEFEFSIFFTKLCY